MIVDEEGREEKDVFEEVVAATVLEEDFLDARMFLTLFAYSRVKGR